MAIDKDKKEELVGSYGELLSRSQGVILADYRAMPMPVLNNLRTQIRNAGGGLHATKNTLIAIALRDAGMGVPEQMLAGSTLVGFAFNDVSSLAKVMLDFSRDNADKFTVKGGVMGPTILSSEDVKSLAALPPLPVLRAQLLGLLQTPASRIASVLAAPGRQIATVLKAYADKAGESSEEVVAGEPAAEGAAAS